MSADGIRISYVASKSPELSRYMANELDEGWKSARGFEVASVGIASVSYDDESKELINMRNKGAMLSDATVREGYVQGSIARGMEAAGSNSAGAAQAFMGMGIGMTGAGSFMASASETNRQQMQNTQSKPSAASGWQCSCGATNTGKFCSECGKKKPESNAWKCSCGATNTGKFCCECGSPRPASSWFCPECGNECDASSRFCPECGTKRP